MEYWLQQNPITITK